MELDSNVVVRPKSHFSYHKNKGRVNQCIGDQIISGLESVDG